MRIAIDASRTTVKQPTGTERYALRLLQTLIDLNARRSAPHELLLYFREAPATALFPNQAFVMQRVIPLARLWTHARFAAALAQDKPDVTFVPAHTLPFVFGGRAAVTVHDLGYCHFPRMHPTAQRMYLDLTTRYSVGRADLILADSQATADDLQRFYGVHSGKIRVVYPGVDAPSVGDRAAVRRKYGLPERYFLFVGTLQPRKNIERLVRAYMRYHKAAPNPAALVLVGGRGWLYDPAWTAGVEGLILAGYADEADKGTLYAGALALVFPSLYEGFGFPLLEAMHCGIPVIASSTSSLPELAGEAALLVDPLEIDALAAAMQLVAEDAALRAELSARGSVQAQHFTWEKAAEAALRTLEDAAHMSPPLQMS
ncbi:MAG: glycosyltransferase family 4 protein [Chloroflexi bacterium]|nr:glycosyltransferase family 4 protein [Chloroflexota bacterium]